MRAAVVAFVLLASSPVLAAPAAKPTSKQACLAAHEEALTLKTSKKPHAAHEKLLICVRNECPTILRKECTDLLESVQATAPTVVVEALDDKGASDTAVKVTLDGIVVAEKLTGSAIDVEPGEHVFVFERASDGKKLDEKILVVEGERNRKVTADYQSLLPKKPDAPPPPPLESKKVPVLAYVAGGVAALGFASFAVFALTGKAKEDDLAGASGCRPNCTDDDVSPVKRSYLIGDISLAIGVLATAAAVIIALPALTAPKSAAQLGPAPWMPRVRTRSTQL